MSRITLSMAAAAVTAMALTGCGSDDSEPTESPTSDAVEAPTSSASTSTPSEESSTEPSEEPTESEGAGTGGAEGAEGAEAMTPDGSELKIGEQAVLPYTYAKESGTIGLSVVGIKKGKNADLKPLELGSQGKGLTPYYITYEVTNVSGGDFDYSALTLNYGLLPDDTKAQNLSVIGDFPKCDSESAPKDFAKGDTYTTCAPVVSAADDVVAALYVGDLDDGIIWRS